MQLYTVIPRLTLLQYYAVIKLTNKIRLYKINNQDIEEFRKLQTGNILENEKCLIRKNFRNHKHNFFNQTFVLIFMNFL